MKDTPGFKELLAYAKAEELVSNHCGYDPDELRKKMKIPAQFVNIASYLDWLRGEALKKSRGK